MRHFVLFLILCLAIPVSAADWPAYGADAQRSFRTHDTLTLPLAKQWTYVPAQVPKPAWPEPGKELHRIDFDYTFQPVIAGDLVVFGSSADHSVRALDLTTGERQWVFTTGGPVRFAPHLWEGKCYFASDDGYIYCLNLKTGEEHWRKRLAPKDDLVVGNEQVTSRWPLRSGLVIEDGILYASAGMWPSEGILVFALNPADGTPIWTNDTTGRVFGDYPHSTYAIGGVAPQGYAAVASKVLVLPTGRAQPAGFDRESGELLYVNKEARRRWPDGGCRVTVWESFMFNGCTFGTLVHVKANPNEADPVNFEGNRSYSVETGKMGGQRFLPTHAYSTNPYYRILVAENRCFKVDSTGFLHATSTKNFMDRKFSRSRWRVGFDGRRIYELAWAGDHLILGDRERILVHDANTGERLAELPVSGQVRGLAISNGRLIAATNRGEIVCFGSGDANPKVIIEQNSEIKRVRWLTKYSAFHSQLRESGLQGFAVIDGIDEIDAGRGLVAAGMRPIQLSDSVASMREEVVAHPAQFVHVLGRSRLHDFPSWFANVVIADIGRADLKRVKRLYRILHPYNGLMWIPGEPSSDLLDLAGIPAEERETLDGGVLIRRGAPPAHELVVKPPFKLSWFGGPGPNRMSDRHITDAPRPQANSGRYVVIGENHLLGVDAYNGVEQWSIPMQNGCLRDAYTYQTQVEMNAGEERLRVDLEHGTSMDFDISNGRLLRYYGLPLASQLYALNRQRVFPLESLDPKLAEERQVKSELALESDADGLLVTVSLTDPVESLYDRVEVALDFRQPKERFGLYGQGAFHFTIHFPTRYDRSTVGRFLLEYPRRITLVPRPAKGETIERLPYAILGAGPEHPEYTLMGEWKEGNVRTVELKISWDEIARVAGHSERDFAFAAFARAGNNVIDTKNKNPFVIMGFFGNEDMVRVNNGWPIFSPEAKTDGIYESPVVSPLLASKDDMPDVVPNEPPSSDTAYTQVPAERHHPLTGVVTRRNIRPAYGCATPISLGTVSYFRSASLAFYDFENDSGVHTIPGVRPGCRDNSGIIPALGRLLYSERSSGCSCAYNFQTSFAFEPVEEGSNEDWGIFYEEPAMDDVRMGSINAGAPGDQRDDDGDLWLGFPRPQHHDRPALVVPASWTLDEGEGYGTYHHNADITPVQNTSDSWIYANGVRGIREMSIDLRRGMNVVALKATEPMVIDGKLDELAWSQETIDERVLLRMPALLYDREYWDRYRSGEGYSDWAATRYDDKALYVAFYDTAKISRRGRLLTWRGQAKEHDDPAINGDHRYEIFLSDGQSKKVVHLVVSASGAQFDALCEDNTKEAEDVSWNGDWEAAATTSIDGFIAEMAVPWQTIIDAGLDMESLQINMGSYSQTPFRDRFLRHLGGYGRDRCLLFVPLCKESVRPTPEREFTMRFHFAEMDETIEAGERQFSVQVQGKTVIDRVDVVADAGGVRRALVKEVKGIRAADRIDIAFIPLGEGNAPKNVPILSGLQFKDTSYVPGELAATR